MKFKKNILLAAAVAAIIAMTPFSALAAVKVGIYGDSRIYGVDTVFDKYITLTSTGTGLIKNHATIKITLKNGEFATDDNGNYLPVYMTDSHSMLEREELGEKLEEGSLNGMAFLPSDDDTVIVTLPENMIDKYAQIMFSASAVDYGDVSLTLSDNRDIDFVVDENTAWDNEKDDEEEEPQIETAEIKVGSNVIYAGDDEIDVDMPAFISTNGYVKIPLRAVSEIFNSDIYWNGAENTIEIINGDDRVVMTVSDNRMYVNDYATPLVSAPEISNGRTFIALRDLEKIFNIENLQWDEETKTATFDYYK